MQPVDSKFRLAPHVRRQCDRMTGSAMLLHPEGAVELSETADAIVQLCDGERSIGEIAAALAADFEIEADAVRSEVAACLDALAARGLLIA